MASWDDVRRIALDLPESGERESRGQPSWRVRDKAFVWERPLRKRDLEELGDAAPDGPILGVWVEDLGAKETLVADESGVFFTTSHFDGYAAVLIELEKIGVEELREVVVEAWLAKAPKRLARQYSDAHL